MSEYDKIAHGSFTSNGGAQVINLPFQPTRVQMWNQSLYATPADHGIFTAYWDSGMGQGTAVCELFTSSTAFIPAVVTSNGISTFAAGQLLQYGTLQTIGASGSITSTSSTVTTIVTTSAHGLSTGNVVVFQNLYQSATTGMNQFAGIPFMVTVTNSTTFTINWNASGSGYTTINGASGTYGLNASFKQVLYPYLYCPGESAIAAINTSTGVITTTAPHNYVVGQQVAFRLAPIWGSTGLNSLPDNQIPGSPIYYYVTAVTQLTFTIAGNISGVGAFVPQNVPFPTTALTAPQVVAVGDVNTGGWPYTGGNLYPSPLLYNGSGTSQVPTINGPAIQGAFVNNTSQGFIIGNGNAVNAGTPDTSSNLCGANGNVIYWSATFG